MGRSPREIIESYRHLHVGTSSPEWRRLEAEIDGIVSAGNHLGLAALLDGLGSEADDPFHLAKQQALNGLAMIRATASVDAFIERTRRLPPGWSAPSDHHARERAALLAHAQDLASLERALGDHGTDASLVELLSSWVQECVVRGRPVCESACVRAFWRRLEEQEHPLAWLPLELAPGEAPLLERTPRDWLGNWFRFAHLIYPSLVDVPALPPSTPASRAGLPEDARARIGSFVGDSHLYPNTTFEIDAFEPTDAAVPDGAPSVERLPLECMEGARGVTQVAVSPRQAFYTLFAMATQGGAYGRGKSAAWGRWHGWRSAGALAGAGAASRFDGAVAAVAAARWTFFDTDSAWWNHVCIDFGLACIPQDGSSLRVLAATDTD